MNPASGEGSLLQGDRAAAAREGTMAIVFADDLQRGDLVPIQEGDIVPADLKLMEGGDWGVDEFELPGEIMAVPKCVRPEADVRVFPGSRVLRGQMLRALDGQGIPPLSPKLGAIHCIQMRLDFVRIALTEIGPKYMGGYGEVPRYAGADLNGLVTKLNTLVDNLKAYPSEGLGQDLGFRLERLQQAGDDTGPIPLKHSPFVRRVAPLAKVQVERRLLHLLGPGIQEAFRSYRRLLEAWVRRAIAEILARFDSHAEVYRAHLARLLNPSTANPAAAEEIRRDLAAHRREKAP
jgi:hypothetical protein